VSYQWSGSGLSATTPSVTTTLGRGVYAFTLTVSDGFGRSASATTYVTVQSPGAGTAGTGDGFVAADVAISGQHVYSVGLVFGEPRLIMLDAIGDGTFSVPRAVRLAGPPTSLSVFDIDLDGQDDVVVTESGGPGLSGAGALEVFTGHFLSLGDPTLFDRSDVALL